MEIWINSLISILRTEKGIDIATLVNDKISFAIHSIQELDLSKAAIELKHAGEIVDNQINTFNANDSDESFNDGFIISEFVKLFTYYGQYLKLLITGKYSESWSSLQDIQSALRIIFRFTDMPRLPILIHIEKQCGYLEQLYPYHVFFSTGFTKESAECSICGKSIDSLECKHVAGELYRGRLAYGIVNQIKELNHIAVVTNPTDKRCTVQILDSSEQFAAISYFANGIKKKTLKPFDFSHLEFRKIRKLKNGIDNCGRNDPCHCGSGRKYKKCCMAKRVIETNHVDIVSDEFYRNELSTHGGRHFIW